MLLFLKSIVSFKPDATFLKNIVSRKPDATFPQTVSFRVSQMLLFPQNSERRTRRHANNSQNQPISWSKRTQGRNIPFRGIPHSAKIQRAYTSLNRRCKHACVCVCVCAPPCQIDHTGFETPHSAQLEIWDCFPASIYAELNCTSASVNSIEYTT